MFDNSKQFIYYETAGAVIARRQSLDRRGRFATGPRLRYIRGILWNLMTS